MTPILGYIYFGITLLDFVYKPWKIWEETRWLTATATLTYEGRNVPAYNGPPDIDEQERPAIH